MLLYLLNLENATAFYTFIVRFLVEGGQNWLDNIAKSMGYEDRLQFVLIIDAGSTGTRVHAIKFKVPLRVLGPTTLDLVEDYYGKTKPGLSDYAHDPAKGAQTVVDLIKGADFFTPLERRPETPIIVRATAGLRLLPKEQAQRILDHVAQAISVLGYKTDSNSVKIMTGPDEGIFNWMGINLLANLEPGETLTALDLGGGSTQRAYKVDEIEATELPSNDVFNILKEEPIRLYSHSYLRLGIMAGRDGILRQEAGNPTTKETIEVTTICLHPEIQNLEWSFFEQNYSVSGADRTGLRPKQVYKLCHEQVKKYVLATVDWVPQSRREQSAAAVGAFYYVAADAGFVDEKHGGGTASVDQFHKLALEVCSELNMTMPWFCLNLIYVVTLLQDGYKMVDDDLIYLFDSIEGVQVSWTTGLAFATVLNQLTATQTTHDEGIISHSRKKRHESSRRHSQLKYL